MVSQKKVNAWLFNMTAAMCMVLYGYDASVFNAVQGSKHWVAYFGNPTATQIGTINSVYIVGNIVAGMLFAPWISNYFGRRVGMASGALVVIAATFVQCFAPRGHLNAFLGGRFLVGIGQGLALPVGPVYISEMSRPEIRGVMLSFWQLFYSVGSFIAFWISYATTRHPELGEWDWRMVVIFQILCPALILMFLPFCPESPRWLISKGKIDAARKALHRVRDTDEEVEEEILSIREAIEYENQELKSSGFEVYKLFWTDKSLLRRFLMALVINAGQQLTGQGSLNSYSTKIYQKVFVDPAKISLINALNATFGILFTLNAAWLVDRFGRRWLLYVGAAGQCICMFIVALVGSQTPFVGAKGDSKTEPVGISIAFLLFAFILFYKPSWGATVWIWTSEVFSMNVRSHAVGMASQTQNVANIIVNQFFPQMLNAIGFYSFFVFAGINAFLFVFTFFILPETRGIPLEEIDTLFGGKSHVEGGAAIIGNGSVYTEDPKGAGSISQTEDVADKLPATDNDKRV